MVTNIDDRVARDRARLEFYRSISADGRFFVTDTALILACSPSSLVLLIVSDIGFRLRPRPQASNGKVPAAPYGDESNSEAESSAGDCHRSGWKIQHVTYYHHYRASQGRNSI